MKCRKGFVIGDTITVLVAVFIMIVVVFVGRLLATELNTAIQEDPDMPDNAKTISSDMNTRYPTVFDSGIVFMFLLLWAIVIVASFMVDAHPIFFIFTVILMAGVLVIGMAINNVYDELIQDADFAGFENQFPMSTFLIQNIVIVTLVVGFSTMLVLYGKLR